jgi:hypothetical protein
MLLDREKGSAKEGDVIGELFDSFAMKKVRYMTVTSNGEEGGIVAHDSLW